MNNQPSISYICVLFWHNIIGFHYFTITLNFVMQYYGVPLSSNNFTFLIIFPSLVISFKNFSYTTCGVKMNNWSHIVQWIHNSLTLLLLVPLFYSNPNLFIFCPYLVIYYKKNYTGTHGSIINNQCHMVQWMCTKLYCIEYSIMGCHYFTITLNCIYFVHHSVLFIQNFMVVHIVSKMNNQSHILWWILNSCLLYRQNTVKCHYPTIVINSSYFLFLLLLFTKCSYLCKYDQTCLWWKIKTCHAWASQRVSHAQ